jgi:signal transduction histidine kinase
LEVICRTTGMGFSSVARVTEKRWIACAVRDEIAFGLRAGGELPVATTLCDEVRDRDEIIAIDEVATDPKYQQHPCPQRYGFPSYISVPIRREDGSFFGTLCAIDPKPARVTAPEIIGMFTLFAELISFHLQLQDRLDMKEQEVLNERETAELREQFIAVLGHDLRNPLSAISASADALALAPSDESGELAALIQRSCARMSGIVANLLDFARGRLGGGLMIERECQVNVAPMLRHVIDEMRVAWPTRVIEIDVRNLEQVSCDIGRVAQLFSNLLANALIHGDPSAPVKVHAHSDSLGFELSVTNDGEFIRPDVISRLFQPFTRTDSDLKGTGLGLGLYIASQIALAHRGTLDVDSNTSQTRFTFKIPSVGA